MSKRILKPGVVTGEGYKTLVEAAKSGGYALPAVNVTGTNTINAEIHAKKFSSVVIRASKINMLRQALFVPDHNGLFPKAKIGDWGAVPGLVVHRSLEAFSIVHDKCSIRELGN